MKKKRIVLYKVRLEEDKQLRNHWTGVKVEEAKQIADIVEPVFRGLDREQIVVLYFDTKMKPIGMEIVAIGGTKACIVETSNIFKGAIAANATAIAMVHNHPSGSISPSKQDFYMTNQMAMAGELLGIPLVDHLILGREDFYSFKKEHPGVRLSEVEQIPRKSCED